MQRPFSRRSFVGHALLWTLGGSVSARRMFHRTGNVLRIGLTPSSSAAMAARRKGATLGVEEAQHTAAMFGWRIDLAGDADASRASDLTALIGDENAASCARAARNLARSGSLLFNVACSADALRGADCAAAMFHIAPSDAMLHDAVAETSQRGSALAWDSSLTRFGADTLNTRFERRFGSPMTPIAWAAWFAVKVLWESAMRIRSADARGIAGHLVDDATQFDGHKGRPLSFRPWDHQLRQPIYVRTASGIVEAPVAKSVDDPSRATLDRLGASATETTCHLQP